MEAYAAVFFERGPDSFDDWEQITARIEKGERKLERNKEKIATIAGKVGHVCACSNVRREGKKWEV